MGERYKVDLEGVEVGESVFDWVEVALCDF